MTPLISGFNHVTLAVRDIKKSFHFYCHILGLKPIVCWDKGAYFLIDGFWFCLNKDEKTNPSEDYTHYAFSISSDDFIPMSQKLIAAGVGVFKENTSPGDSFYFLDPDGNKLEIHVGTWQTRVAAKKNNIGTWQDVEWFI